MSKKRLGSVFPLQESKSFVDADGHAIWLPTFTDDGREILLAAEELLKLGHVELYDLAIAAMDFQAKAVIRIELEQEHETDKAVVEDCRAMLEVIPEIRNELKKRKPDRVKVVRLAMDFGVKSVVLFVRPSEPVFSEGERSNKSQDDWKTAGHEARKKNRSDIEIAEAFFKARKAFPNSKTEMHTEAARLLGVKKTWLYNRLKEIEK